MCHLLGKRYVLAPHKGYWFRPTGLFLEENMEYLYIDESGTMTTDYCNDFPYFIISVVRIRDNKTLKRKIKRFVSRHLEELKANDKSLRMFKDGKFKELKGSALTVEMKIKFANYLMNCGNMFEVDIIKIENKRVNPATYDNTARAFNYFLDLFLTYRSHLGNYPFDDYLLQIDERNVKTDARRSLEDYLSIELCLKQKLFNKIQVSYFDSCDNSFVQLSDFFANLYFSYLKGSSKYKKIIAELKTNNILRDDFIFPLH